MCIYIYYRDTHQNYNNICILPGTQQVLNPVEFCRTNTPRKTKITMEQKPCEDVTSLQNGDFPLPC